MRRIIYCACIYLEGGVPGMHDFLSVLRKERFIAIARGIAACDIAKVTEALYEGGVRFFEITFNPSRPETAEETALSIREAIKAAGAGMAIGAGTVICREYLEAAFQAGAGYIISPDTDEEIIKRTKELGLYSIPGAYTPTEIKAAYKAGADVVKLFPITVNEIPYLKNISAPLPHIPFLTTGGVNPDTAAAFIEAGAVAVAAGASVVKPDLVRNGDFAEITRLAALHVKAVSGR